MEDQKKYATKVQMAIGIDLLGSALSLSNKNGTTLEVTGIGIVARSKKTGRVVVIPYTNIKGFELAPDGVTQITDTKKPGRPKAIVAA